RCDRIWACGTMPGPDAARYIAAVRWPRDAGQGAGTEPELSVVGSTQAQLLLHADLQLYPIQLIHRWYLSSQILNQPATPVIPPAAKHPITQKGKAPGPPKNPHSATHKPIALTSK